MKRTKEVVGGAFYARKAMNMLDWQVAEFWEDVLQEAEAGNLDSEDSPRNAAQRFIYNQVHNKGMTGGHGSIRKKLNTDAYTEAVELESLPRLPVVALSRLLYRLLKMRPGKRRRHSAALKALILADRCDGIIFDVIAGKYNIGIDNAKRHYRMAWTLLRGWFTQNAAMLSSKQLELFQSCTLKDVHNKKKKGERYDYSRRFEN